jgi:metal transporter CNNM
MGADLVECLRHCKFSGDQDETHHCVSDCLQTVGLYWEVDHSSELGVLPSLLIVGVVLVPLCALFSGLTLGLLSLDLNGLKILAQGGDPKEREYAKTIMPVRERGNLLLCTLLLGNTIVNAATSVLLADITSGLIGVCASTFLIVIFGEIIPQSVCTRHGLKIGALSIPLVKLFQFLLFPVAWPISRLLDRVLGRDIGTVYSQKELERLIDLHYLDPDAQRESGLTITDHRLLLGALQYKHKTVHEIMTPLEDVFMLEKSVRLNFQTMLAIYKSGYTRVPVYEGESRQNIVGILYSKDLILVDPDDEIEIAAVLSLRSRNVGNVRHVSDDATLDKVFLQFLASNNHMLIAHRLQRQPPPLLISDTDGEQLQELSQPFEVTGLITMEDVLEELLQAEITDETDTWEETGSRRGPRREERGVGMSLFEHKIVRDRALSPQEIQAVGSFLSDSVAEFAGLASSDVALKGLIRHSEVLERDVAVNGEASDALQRMLSRSMSLGEVAGHAFNDLAEADSQLVLYRRGVPSNQFTLILQGRVLIHTGAEDFELELGPWSVLGQRAMVAARFVPDFDAVALPPCRLLRVTRSAYTGALAAARPGAALSLPSGAKRVRSPLDGGKAPVPTASEVVSPQGTIRAQHIAARRPTIPSTWRATFAAGDGQAEAGAGRTMSMQPNTQGRQKDGGILQQSQMVASPVSPISNADVPSTKQCEDRGSDQEPLLTSKSMPCSSEAFQTM